MSIKIADVSFTYMKGTPYERKALNNINLEIAKGEFVAIIGHTGSGKSTLIQHMNALLAPSTGRITVDDLDMSDKNNAKKMRLHVGMVFQYPEHQLFGETVYEDVAFGPRNLKMSEAQVAERVQEAMSFVGMDFETFKERSPFQLSGGQMRRIAIAGVVAMQPDYLILDEPSAGLDPRARNAIFEEICKLYEEKQPAVILVTHNMEEAAKYAKRILVMSQGEIVCDGTPEEIFLHKLPELDIAGVDVPEVIKLSGKLRNHRLAQEPYSPTAQALAEDVWKVLHGANI